MAFEWKEHSVLNLTFVIKRLLVKFDQFISGFAFETSYLPFKVIPLFCTAHPLLRVILRHPRWRRLFPLVRKEQTRATFAELKLLFAILPQIGWELPGLQLTNKEMKKKCVWSRSLQWCFTLQPSSCGIKFKNVLAEALDGAVNPMGQLYGSLTVSGLGSLLCICCSNSKCGETNICRTNKTHRSTRTTRGRPIFDVNTKFAAEFTSCCVCFGNIKHIKKTENKLDLECILRTRWALFCISPQSPPRKLSILTAISKPCPPFTAVCEETSTVTPDFFPRYLLRTV